MRKSLGQYNIEKSSSSDVNNISWSQKKQKEKDIPRKKKVVKKTQIPSGTNIIYKKNEDKKTVKKTFTIDKPTIVKNREDKEVYVTQVGWAGIRLGKITISTNKKTRITTMDAHTINVSNKFDRVG